MSKAKILIVDDHGMYEECKDKVVWPDGKEIFHTTAKKAVSTLLEATVDIVVVDGCGLQLIEDIRSIHFGKMLAASDNTDHRILAKEAGCDYQCPRVNVAGMVGAILEMSHF